MNWGLRTRSMVLFTVSAFVASAVLSIGAWFVSAQVLLHQRESLAERQALAGASLLALAAAPGGDPFSARGPLVRLRPRGRPRRDPTGAAAASGGVREDGERLALPGRGTGHRHRGAHG